MLVTRHLSIQIRLSRVGCAKKNKVKCFCGSREPINVRREIKFSLNRSSHPN